MDRGKLEELASRSDSPGSIDLLNTSQLFDSDNGVGIPAIAREEWSPDFLYPYKTRIRTDYPPEEDGLIGAVHFFLDDFRFEAVWSRPQKGLSYVERAGYALSPDFSLYRDHPLALQLFNVYRSRWCGAFWQSQGVSVIPTVGWSDEESYPFCFLGIEEGSTVAISPVGVERARGSQSRRLFAAGCREMLSRIGPQAVLFYGECDQHLIEESGLGEVELLGYPSRWVSIKEARKEASGRK